MTTQIEAQREKMAFEIVSKIALDESKKVAEVLSNSEWDSIASHALVDLGAAKELEERYQRVMDAAGKDGEGIGYLPFSEGFVELFLRETSITVAELKRSKTSEMDIGDIDSYIVIGDVVYEKNECPNSFSENVWVSESTKVSSFSAVEVWYGKHTGEELWVDVGF